MTPDQAEAYRPHVDSSFEVDGACRIRLEQVAAFEDAATEGFSLRFVGPREVLVPQGIRILEHPSLGHLELFLVPVNDPRRDCYTYEAIFNRLKLQAASAGGA